MSSVKRSIRELFLISYTLNRYRLLESVRSLALYGIEKRCQNLPYHNLFLESFLWSKGKHADQDQTPQIALKHM